MILTLVSTDSYTEDYSRQGPKTDYRRKRLVLTDSKRALVNYFWPGQRTGWAELSCTQKLRAPLSLHQIAWALCG
ncbi:hypothetical protein BaRGS_00007874 [Batillaria attramentaria]|uniref:Transposase n=1 Tax=Batillaria attramentaria TaxID=370345 RepID=A0ABD0LPP0_9CAEN